MVEECFYSLFHPELYLPGLALSMTCDGVVIEVRLLPLSPLLPLDRIVLIVVSSVVVAM